jgi:hypothetical protein
MNITQLNDICFYDIELLSKDEAMVLLIDLFDDDCEITKDKIESLFK